MNLAVSLSRDTQLLQILRKTLREQMRKSPLMDVKRYMQDLEKIYRQLLYA